MFPFFIINWWRIPHGRRHNRPSISPFSSQTPIRRLVFLLDYAGHEREKKSAAVWSWRHQTLSISRWCTWCCVWCFPVGSAHGTGTVLQQTQRNHQKTAERTTTIKVRHQVLVARVQVSSVVDSFPISFLGNKLRYATNIIYTASVITLETDYSSKNDTGRRPEE